jgi:hypothetical protein
MVALTLHVHNKAKTLSALAFVTFSVFAAASALGLLCFPSARHKHNELCTIYPIVLPRLSRSFSDPLSLMFSRCCCCTVLELLHNDVRRYDQQACRSGEWRSARATYILFNVVPGLRHLYGDDAIAPLRVQSASVLMTATGVHVLMSKLRRTCAYLTPRPSLSQGDALCRSIHLCH